MSVGGDGIIFQKPMISVFDMNSEELGFVARRFKAGGRLNISDSPEIRTTPLITCVLCGGIITDVNSTLEHPIPQWLHRFAKDSSDSAALAFSTSNQTSTPTWRQLCLASHKVCNAQFAKKIEEPAINPLKSIVQGRRVTWSEIDIVFDWLDKVKSTSVHMATALLGHKLRLSYDDHAFPNRRIGLFDRLAIFTRLDNLDTPLDLWNCLSNWFITTPSPIVLRINNLLTVFASNNYLLSKAFGLSIPSERDGDLMFSSGTNYYAPGFGTRTSRFRTSVIVAQPMRRQHQAGGWAEQSPALQSNGDGYVFQLKGNRWNKVKSLDFSDMTQVKGMIAYHLATLESLEWNIISKEQDYVRYRNLGNFFMNSYSEMIDQKRELLHSNRPSKGWP